MPLRYRPDPLCSRGMRRLSAVAFVLALAIAAPADINSLLDPGDAAGVLYCTDGVYPFGTGTLPLKAFRKGALLRLALPYRRPGWRLSLRYVFRYGQMIPERLKSPRPFPEVRIGVIEICLNAGSRTRCQERPKSDWKTHWDPSTATLWLNLEYRGPLKAVRVTLRFGEGDCGGFLRYRAEGLPW